MPAYDPMHICQTPGAVYNTRMAGETLMITVVVPSNVALPADREAAEILEAQLHYAIENVMKQFWK